MINQLELFYHLSKINFPFSLYFLYTQQALPDDSYTTEDHDVFAIAGRTCIEEGNSAQVLSIILDEKNQVHCSKLNLLVYTLDHKCVAYSSP